MPTARAIQGVDTYWCHTVSVFTAFSPNRIGECDTYYRTYYRTYCCTNWCTIHVGSGTVTVIVLGQRPDGEGAGQGVLRQGGSNVLLFILGLDIHVPGGLRGVGRDIHVPGALLLGLAVRRHLLVR